MVAYTKGVVEKAEITNRPEHDPRITPPIEILIDVDLDRVPPLKPFDIDQWGDYAVPKTGTVNPENEPLHNLELDPRGDLLGEGGTAEVYRVSDETGQEYAAKVFRTNIHYSETDTLARAMAEAGIYQVLQARGFPVAAKLKYFGVYPENNENVPVEFRGRPVAIYEKYPEGMVSLQEKMKQGLSFEAALDILDQVAGLIDQIPKEVGDHGDITPENIQIDEEGKVYLTDFGDSAAVHRQLGLEDQPRGNPSYNLPGENDPVVQLAKTFEAMLAGMPLADPFELAAQLVGHDQIRQRRRINVTDSEYDDVNQARQRFQRGLKYAPFDTITGQDGSHTAAIKARAQAATAERNRYLTEAYGSNVASEVNQVLERATHPDLDQRTQTPKELVQQLQKVYRSAEMVFEDRQRRLKSDGQPTTGT